MKKIFTCLLTIFFVFAAVNFADAAKDKTEKIKFDNKKLKSVQLTESPARNNPVLNGSFHQKK